jgi:hypothetical protein
MMLYFNRLKQSKGQALIEAALIAPLIIFFLFTVIWFARVALTWQQLVSAARYGSDMLAYTPFSEEDIKKHIESYLCSKMTIGRALDKNKLEIEVKANDFPGADYSLDLANISEFNPLDIVTQMTKFLDWDADKSYVELKYKFDIPPILRIGGQSGFEIKMRSEVLSGDGSAAYKKRKK